MDYSSDCQKFGKLCLANRLWCRLRDNAQSNAAKSAPPSERYALFFWKLSSQILRRARCDWPAFEGSLQSVCNMPLQFRIGEKDMGGSTSDSRYLSTLLRRPPFTALPLQQLGQQLGQINSIHVSSFNGSRQRYHREQVTKEEGRKVRK